MVDVVGAPLTVHEVPSEGSDQPKQTLVDVDLCENLEPGHFSQPSSGVAEVFIVDDVVAHEIIEESGFGSP